MRYCFRVDASVLIGSGHVLRCLTLASALRDAGQQVVFISREYPGHLIALIEKQGFSVKVLPYAEQDAYLKLPCDDDYQKWLGVAKEEDAYATQKLLDEEKPVDYLILDHYALDVEWERLLRSYVNKIVVIDDLANRVHDCDLLIDPNFYLNFDKRYEGLVPAHCRKLLGPHYALIRLELLKVREERALLNKFKPHPIRNILIYLGGADLKNVTMQVLESLLLLPHIENYHIDVIVGLINPHQNIIKDYCKKYSFIRYHCQPDYYLELLREADVAIAASGASAYERYLIGLPSLSIVIAENQRKLAVDLEALGCHVAVLDYTDLTLKEKITRFIGQDEISVDVANIIYPMGIASILQEIL